jgi:type I restriction enzyme M protein
VTTTFASAETLVRRLWQFCNVLRDDGMSYPDYVEQLTYLLFLKMASEEGNEQLPEALSWDYLTSASEAPEMKERYGDILAKLSTHPGVLGLIFAHARNKIADPAKLRLLVEQLIGTTRWTSLSFDVKGDVYEGLLEKNARDTKSGAGQYFTPRALIDAIVECVNPTIGETICDPACGTAGFLLGAHAHMRRQVGDGDRKSMESLREESLYGTELVEEVARLAAMNLYLHGVGGSDLSRIPITRGDSLEQEPSRTFDVVLSNPPFGTKGSVTYVGPEGKAGRSGGDLTVRRADFTIQTSNKQLNFLQHIFSLLKPGGRAAVVLPDNVLYEAGPAASALRRRLLEENNVRAVLRLPTGLFYAQSVKASVLFFSKGRSSSPATPRGIWAFDLRTDQHFSIRSRPIAHSDLKEFVTCFLSTPDGSTDQAFETDLWKMHDEEHILRDGGSFEGLWRVARETHSSSVSRLDDLSRQVIGDLEQALILVRRAVAGIKSP